MIFCNVDHIDIEELQNLSREGAAAFLNGGASLFAAMAQLESGYLKVAGTTARNAIAHFDNAAPALGRLAVVVGGGYAWLKEEFRKLDAAEAARNVHLPVDQALVKEIVQGNLDRVIASCAGMSEELSAKLRVFADRAEKASDARRFDYTLAHETLGLWRAALERGQQISGLCMLFNLAGAR